MLTPNPLALTSKRGISAALVGLLLAALPVQADNASFWKISSDIGAYGLVGTALAVPVGQGDWIGLAQAGLSVATATGIGLLGKALLDVERPDQSGDDGFPSNHAANSFAAATTLHRRYGWKLGFPAYGVAALVGAGRIQADKHYWADVCAGAAIGVFAGWLFTEAFDGTVKIVPWASRREAGLALAINW